MSQPLLELHRVSGRIVSPGALAYIHSGRASVSGGRHREDTRETLAFSTSSSWNCVVVCPAHCSRRSSFAVLGETMLALTSNPWDSINPWFAENGPAHPNAGCHSGASGYPCLRFAWTLSVSTGALSGGYCLTMPPGLSWEDGSSYQLDDLVARLLTTGSQEWVSLANFPADRAE